MTTSSRILVIDDEEEIGTSLMRILSTMGYEADAVSDEARIFQKLAEFSPGLILLDIHLAGSANGIDVCRRIKQDPAHRGAVVIMMTAAIDKESVESSIRAGASDYIAKPFKAQTLIQKIFKYQVEGPGKSKAPPPAALLERSFRVLIVDDDADIRKSVEGLLNKAGYQTEAVPDAIRTFKMLREFKPHLILLDINLSRGLDGIEICRRIKEERGGADVKVIMMTGVSDRDSVEKSIEAGSVDYIVKPIQAEALVRKITSHLMGAAAADRIAGPPEPERPDVEEAQAEEESPVKRRRGSGLASARAAVNDDDDAELKEEPTP